jgi:3'(2'), 5'-bisphosphate nucleotidase
MPAMSSRRPAAGSVAAADHDLAARTAREAGSLLVELRARLHRDGVEPDTMKQEGDRQSHDLLVQRLSDARPGDAILSEEGKDDAERLDSSRVWIVDPLDGTREFGEWPRDDWAVHVALVVDGAPVCGAVALPARGRVLSTAEPIGPPSHAAVVPRVAVSRTRMPAPVLELADRLGAEQVPLGSAGVKTMAVLLGDADIYAHDGGQYEWDSAAPIAVALAAGLHCSRLDGSALRYNNADPSLPDLIVCHPELAERSLALLATIPR